MGVVTLDAESTIRGIVEAMLPRFSDDKLGLLIGLNMEMDDLGYGMDGSTIEREPLAVHRHVHFLFSRPNNYTKVFLWIADPNAKGLDNWPANSKEPLEWLMTCDHDSCWCSDGLSSLSKIHFEMLDIFRNRKVGGKDIHFDAIHEFYRFDGNPSYVRLIHFEKRNPTADRFSKDSRPWMIKMEKVDLLSTSLPK